MKPSPRLPARAVALMLASAGMFLLPLHGADNPAASPAAAKPALAMPGPLPDGTIELLAITSGMRFEGSSLWLAEVVPTNTNPVQEAWWTADGSRAKEFRRNPLKQLWRHSITTHTSTYAFFFRTKTNPSNATWVLSGLGSSSAWAFDAKEGPMDEVKSSDGRLTSDILCFVADISWVAKQADFTVSIASGPWENIAKVGADPKGPGISKLLIYDKEGYKGEGGYTVENQSVIVNIRRNDAHWSLEMRAAEITDDDKSTHPKVTVIHNINTGRPENPLEWEVRVIAIDQSGKEHLSDTDSFGDRTLTHAFSNTAYEFRDLPFAQAKEFILQVRPFQSQKFSHVALEPKSAVAPTAPAPKP